MTKVKNQKESKKDEFRKEKETGHPAYIYAKIGNKFKKVLIGWFLSKSDKEKIDKLK